MGQRHHRFGKYADFLSTREWEGCIFGFFHLETCFQKSVFSGAALQYPCGRSSKTLQYMCVFAKERFHVDGLRRGSEGML